MQISRFQDLACVVREAKVPVVRHGRLPEYSVQSGFAISVPIRHPFASRVTETLFAGAAWLLPAGEQAARSTPIEVQIMELAHLIEQLAEPAAYPYPVKDVEVLQTHISAVFLAGPYA